MNKLPAVISSWTATGNSLRGGVSMFTEFEWSCSSLRHRRCQKANPFLYDTTPCSEPKRMPRLHLRSTSLYSTKRAGDWAAESRVPPAMLDLKETTTPQELPKKLRPSAPSSWKPCLIPREARSAAFYEAGIRRQEDFKVSPTKRSSITLFEILVRSQGVDA